MEEVQISKKEYLSLYRDSLELAALEAAGVDNWEFYGEVDWDKVDKDIEALEKDL